MGAIQLGSAARATIWNSTTPTDLNAVLDSITGVGWTLDVAYAINLLGQILGHGTNGLGQTRAFLLTPCDKRVAGVPPVSAFPLPAALPLFATALGGLGLLGWRRKRKAA